MQMLFIGVPGTSGPRQGSRILAPPPPTTHRPVRPPVVSLSMPAASRKTKPRRVISLVQILTKNMFFFVTLWYFCCCLFRLFSRRKNKSILRARELIVVSRAPRTEIVPGSSSSLGKPRTADHRRNEMKALTLYYETTKLLWDAYFGNKNRIAKTLQSLFSGLVQKETQLHGRV